MQLASIYTYAVVTTSIAFFLTITLNVFATGIIVVRLLLHRRRLVRVMGGKSDVGDCYTNIAAILMESAALVVVFDIFFAVTFIKGGPLFNLCSEMIGHIQVSVYTSRPAGIKRHHMLNPHITGDRFVLDHIPDSPGESMVEYL